MRRKRSNRPYRIERAEPQRLDPAFPLQVMEHPDHGDRPIASLHTHPFPEFGLCHSGSGIFVIAGEVRTFEAGSVVFIPAGIPHFAQSRPGTRSAWTWFWADIAAVTATNTVRDTHRFINLPGHGLMLPPAKSRRLAAILGELREEHHARASGWMQAAAWLLRIACIRLHRSVPRNTPAARAPLDRVGPALAYLGRHPEERPAIPDLARLCGMSPASFRRHFRSEVGESPLAYVLRLRVNAVAAALRRSGATITELALENGFDSLSAFQRSFRRILGCTAKEWKRRAGTRS